MFRIFDRLKFPSLIFTILVTSIFGGCDQLFAPFNISEPTSFMGTLSCIDCDGERVQLNLFPDSVYIKKTVRLGDESTKEEFGTWGLSSNKEILVLRSSENEVSYFFLANNTRLIALNNDAKPYQTSQPNHLSAQSEFTWADVGISLRGEYMYFADSHIFTECSTGKQFPIYPNQTRLELERTFTQRQEGEHSPLTVQLSGSLMWWQNMEGPKRISIEVSEVVDSKDSLDCVVSNIKSDIFGVEWKLEWLNGVARENIALGEKPFLKFDSEVKRIHGFSGCNSFSGGFSLDESHISFSAIASTRRACFPENNVENMLFTTLEDAQYYEVIHPRLLLFDENRKEIAAFRF